MSIAFTVSNPAKVSEELLESAAQNAQAKAEILCRASGITFTGNTELGAYLYIDYNQDAAFTTPLDETGKPVVGSEIVSFSSYKSITSKNKQCNSNGGRYNKWKNSMGRWKRNNRN